MATLTLPLANVAGQASTQEGSAEGIRKPLEDSADPGDMDSEWVVLGKSDVIPADLAAAAAASAAAGCHRLNFSPLPMIPIWAQMILGGVVYTAIPFYKRARKVEGETLANVETAVEVLEHVAEVIEKLAANAADSLPENGPFQKVAMEIECIAEVVDKDAQKVEAAIEKIEEVCDKIDAAVEPIIEELEKDFKKNPASSTGSDAQK